MQALLWLRGRPSAQVLAASQHRGSWHLPRGNDLGPIGSLSSFIPCQWGILDLPEVTSVLESARQGSNLSCPVLAPVSPSTSPGTRLAEPCWPQLLSEPLCAEAAVCARQCGAISCLYPLLATAEASRHKPKAHCPFPDLEVGKKVTQQVPGSVPARILLVYLPLWAGAWQVGGSF